MQLLRPLRIHQQQAYRSLIAAQQTQHLVVSARVSPSPMSTRRSPADPDVAISKAMSRILRHHPPPSMDAQGWVTLPVLLKQLRQGVTEEQVRRIVDNNDKKRFVLDESTDPPRIRAAQGHSVQLEDPVLEAVTSADSVPWAVHVTSQDGWQGIQDSGELRRMSRTHIHFATLPHHMRGNSWAQILLRLDLQAAMSAGFKFYLSTNQVLLCEGPLPVEYVAQVQASDLPQDWQAQRQQAGRGGGGGGQKGGKRGPGSGRSSQEGGQERKPNKQQQRGAASLAVGKAEGRGDGEGSAPPGTTGTGATAAGGGGGSKSGSAERRQ